MNERRWLTGLALVCLTTCLSGQTGAQAPALVSQCETLRSEGEPAEAVRKNLDALKDKDAKVRQQAAQKLAVACDRRAVDSLLILLNDAEPAVRIAAVETLGKLGARTTIDPLLEALNGEKDWTVKYAYADALAAFQVHRASYDVLNALANPQGGQVKDLAEMRTRCHAILLVNQLRDVNFSRKAVGILFEFIDDRRPEFRQLAEQTFQRLGETRNGKHELMGILRQNRYPEYQLKAVTWLGRLGIEDAREVLLEMSKTEIDARVKKAIQETIALLDKKQAAEKH